MALQYLLREHPLGYSKVQRLGSGAFGEVWKVKGNPPIITDWHFAAMKIIKNPDANALNEAKLLKQFQHPNIIKYYSSFKDVSTADLYITMEFCDKGTLADKIPHVRFILTQY